MTCDNAKNNDIMIQELKTLTLEFSGFASHTQCFLHIMNLVAKSMLHQFDTKKVTIKRDSEMVALADELAEEKAIVDEIEDNDDNEVDHEDGWIDDMNSWTKDERIKLKDLMQPVRLALAKVS